MKQTVSMVLCAAAGAMCAVAINAFAQRLPADALYDLAISADGHYAWRVGRLDGTVILCYQNGVNQITCGRAPGLR